jgi:hypothetical protein
VPGFNFARLGAGTKCVGCHTGHSQIQVPINNFKAKWFNGAPSAEVTASSVGAGSARGVVDRRTRGGPAEVAWVAQGTQGEWIRLAWNRAVEVRSLVLYAVAEESSAGTSLRVRETEITFWRDGREVKRLDVRRELGTKGTRIDCEPVRVDAIRVSPVRISGLVQRRAASALAEIEAIVRLVEDPFVPGD